MLMASELNRSVGLRENELIRSMSRSVIMRPIDHWDSLVVSGIPRDLRSGPFVDP